MPSRTTVEEVGTKSIQIKTTGNEKTRFTTMLAITADGRKLPPYIVFRRKTLPKDTFPPGIHVRAHESGSFNEDITRDWATWGPLEQGINAGPRLLQGTSHRLREAHDEGVKD